MSLLRILLQRRYWIEQAEAKKERCEMNAEQLADRLEGRPEVYAPPAAAMLRKQEDRIEQLERENAELRRDCITCKHHDDKAGYDLTCFECKHFYASKYEAMKS